MINQNLIYETHLVIRNGKMNGKAAFQVLLILVQKYV